MALNFDKMKEMKTDKERVAKAWDVVEQSMDGQNITHDQLNTAQWVIQMSPERQIGLDQCCPAPWPIEPEPKKKKKKKGKKRG
jgi:hypothetical protein